MPEGLRDALVREGHWWTSRDTLSESDVEDLLAYPKTL